MTLSPLFDDLDRVWQALDVGHAIVTPNHRLSRAVADAWARRQQRNGHKAWKTAAIMPIRQWWRQCWARAVTRGLLPPANHLDIPGQRLLWRKVIDEQSGEGGFSLISPERAAVLCQEAHERMLLWRIDPADSAIAQEFSFDPDAQAFLRWERRYCQLLKERSLEVPEQSLTALLECPEAFDQAALLLHTASLPPLYEALANMLPSTERIRRDVSTAPADEVHAFADERSELRAIARWCRSRAEADPGGRYAVVLGDMGAPRDALELLLRREFDCLTRNYDSLPVNFATGFELRRVPLVRDALRVLDLCREQVSCSDLVAALHSRFLAALPIADGESLLRTVYDLNSEYLPQWVLRQLLDAARGTEEDALPWDRVRHLESQDRLYQQHRHPSAWTPVFHELLEAWGWPRGLALDSLEYQQLELFKAAMESFSSRDALLGTLGFDSACQALGQHLQEQLFQPRTEDVAVQVLGRLETTGLSFDGMWIAGMRADRWPEQPRANPYLPRRLQRRYAMPHADSAWEQERARERWNDWRGGTRQLLCSYVAQEDGAAIRPSAMVGERPGLEPRVERLIPDAWIEQAMAAEFDPIELTAVAPRAGEAALDGVSGAALEQQALCPFQAFAAQRLRVTAPGRPLPGLSPGERGSMLHRALFSLFAQVQDNQSLERLGDGEREAAARRAALESVSVIPGLRRTVLGSAVLTLEEQRIEAALLRWLDVEAARSVPWRVVEREVRRDLILETLALRLRLDRVDELANGQRLVIDYKSGAADPLARWFESPPRRPQLPLYALSEPLAGGIAYASLKPGKQGYRGVGQDTGIKGLEDPQRWLAEEAPEGRSFGTLREDWRLELGQLAGDFLRGENSVDPSVDACRYCARHELCRIGDLVS